MQISGTCALVTGANRGLGREFAIQLLERGAARVYATARRPDLVGIDGVEVLPLDVTDPASIAAAAAAASDVNVLINNAGVLVGVDVLGSDLGEVMREVDTNLWGSLRVIRAFAPILGANGGGAILTMLSAMSWFSVPGLGSYSVAKAAAWAMTNSVRLELAAQHTLVTALHVGAVDTDMQAGNDIPKASPRSVVATALDGIEHGRIEVLADDRSAEVKAALADDPGVFYGNAVVTG